MDSQVKGESWVQAAESSSPLGKSGTCPFLPQPFPWNRSTMPCSAMWLLQELVKRLKRTISEFHLKRRVTTKRIYMNVWSEEFRKHGGGGSRGDHNYSKALTQMLKQMHVGQEGGWAKRGLWGTSWHKGKARVSWKMRVGMAVAEDLLWDLWAARAENEHLPHCKCERCSLTAQGELSLSVWWEMSEAALWGWREPDPKLSWTHSWTFPCDGHVCSIPDVWACSAG